MKRLLIVLLLSFTPALMAKPHPAPAHIKAHVANCVERYSFGKGKSCFVTVVLINAFNEPISPGGFSNTFYADWKGRFNFTLNKPGLYRITLVSAHSINKPWVRVLAATPGAHVNIGEI